MIGSRRDNDGRSLHGEHSDGAVLREKARVRAVMGCRSLAGYIRQLVRADIRIYEAENGPISISDTEKECTP